VILPANIKPNRSHEGSSQEGFSLIEVFIVLLIIGILATLSIISLNSNRLYGADSQAQRLSDFFNEARQRALTERRTFRVQLNRTKWEIWLINEGLGNPTGAADDRIIRREAVSPDIAVGGAPTGLTNAPTASSPVPIQNYITSTYPLSAGDETITLRFKRNGDVVDEGTDAVGTNSVVTGATILIYPISGVSGNIRAITVAGPGGDSLTYKCIDLQASGQCGNWGR
jgi:prepilin-type N-terminal cleavage/methylation domain-containing protein